MRCIAHRALSFVFTVPFTSGKMFAPSRKRAQPIQTGYPFHSKEVQQRGPPQLYAVRGHFTWSGLIFGMAVDSIWHFLRTRPSTENKAMPWGRSISSRQPRVAFHSSRIFFWESPRVLYWPSFVGGKGSVCVIAEVVTPVLQLQIDLIWRI